MNGLAIETHLVGRENLRAEFGHDLAVDRYHTRRDEVVGLTPRADTRLGDKTVQTHLSGLHRRIVFRVGDRLVGTLAGTFVEGAALGALCGKPAALQALAVIEFPGSFFTAGGFRAVG